jgi:hypothetical protein
MKTQFLLLILLILSLSCNDKKLTDKDDLIPEEKPKYHLFVADEFAMGVDLRSWSRYALSTWGDDGRPTKAMDASLEE